MPHHLQCKASNKRARAGMRMIREDHAESNKSHQGVEGGLEMNAARNYHLRQDHRPFYLLAIQVGSQPAPHDVFGGRFGPQEWTARMCPTSGEDNTAKGHSKAA